MIKRQQRTPVSKSKDKARIRPIMIEVLITVAVRKAEEMRCLRGKDRPGVDHSEGKSTLSLQTTNENETVTTLS